NGAISIDEHQNTLSQFRMVITVDSETKEYRKSLCKQCEHFKTTLQICSQCGCFMPVKWTLQSAWCPIKKWPRTDIEN
ncbi:uncharacterized protein METZ01_LOCUS105465, partial [marine metagenome]